MGKPTITMARIVEAGDGVSEHGLKPIELVPCFERQFDWFTHRIQHGIYT